MFGGGFSRFFEVLQRGFAFCEFGFEGVDLVLLRQLVVAAGGGLDAVLADDAAV